MNSYGYKIAIVTAAVLLIAGCRRSEKKPTELRLVVTAEIHGTLEPCGCNSDPLGDVARIFPLVKGGLLLDAGSLLYNPLDPAGHQTEADARARALADLYARHQPSAVGLGPADFHGATSSVAPRRFCQNVRADFCRPAEVVVVNGTRVGVFGVVDPLLVPNLAAQTSSAEQAVAEAISKLRKDGAEIVVGLFGMERKRVRALVAGVAGIDVAVVGVDVGDGMAAPEQVNQTYLVAAAEEGKRVAVLTFHGAKAGSWRVALGASSQKLEQAKLTQKIAAAEAALQRWRADPGADANFIAGKEKELAALKASQVRSTAAGATAGTFEYDLVPVRRSLERDTAVATTMKQLDHQIGAQNLATAQKETSPTELSYVGIEACRTCHAPAVAFWERTRHAGAWKTLVDVEKQYHYNCIGCHVTGWNKAGGPTLQNVESRRLVNVGCEVCHGPGAGHVTATPELRKKFIVRKPADDYCLRECHTVEHSDTFERAAYLRDILGEGHGAERKKELGSGPTGHELRAQAKAKMAH